MIAPIAQIVVDLPLEGPFDYIIPEGMKGCVQVGMRVMVPFGARPVCGFVIGLLQESQIPKLKSINSVCESQPTFTPWMIEFAKHFSRHYGCSLGESLATMLPPLLRKGRSLSFPKACVGNPGEGNTKDYLQGLNSSKPTVFISPSGNYDDVLRDQISPVLTSNGSVLVLVPDAYAMKQISAVLNKYFSGQVIELKEEATLKEQVDHWVKVRNASKAIVLGARSAVFAPINDLYLTLMIDENDASFKQEQSPLYETRDVLLMRAKVQGFALSFCCVTPSVEIWQGINEGKYLRKDLLSTVTAVKAQAVDLTNYKFLGALLSPPVRNGLDEVLKNKAQGLIILNRRGTYSVTRCVDCAQALRCQHCDSPLVYARIKKLFSCRHCTFTLPGNTPCPACKKINWKSFGVGIEHVQAELFKYFPTARTAFFDGTKEEMPKDFDILIATQAILRFSDQLQCALVACVDFDSELNRMDMRSSLKAFSLARRVKAMASKQFFVQSRNLDHYVIKSLVRDDAQGFYDQELALRKEMGFAPFKHWVEIMCRSRIEKSAQEFAQLVYNELIASKGKAYVVAKPAPDAIFKKRDQFRFNVMVQGDAVIPTMDVVKAALAKVKRSGRVIVTLNVDA